MNFSTRNLADSVIALLSKRLNFVPTSNRIDKAKLKTELETLGRVLRLKWHFRNEENEFELDQFKPKSTFNPRNKDATAEVYMSSLEEKLMKIEMPKDKYNNITSKERQALYDLKNNKNIVIKGADKGSAVVIWDRDHYIKQAEKQLGDSDVYDLGQRGLHKGSRKQMRDSDVYEEVLDDPEPLISTMHRTIENNMKRGDLKKRNYLIFEVKDPKFARFYLLPKIHKRLNNVLGRPEISNCGYYTENISAFLDFHLQPLAHAVKSYVKDTSGFFNKPRSLPKLPDNIILSTVDVVGL